MDSIDESARSKAIALKAIRGVFIERDVRDRRGAIRA